MKPDSSNEEWSMLLRLSHDFPLCDLFAVADRLIETNICVPGYIAPPASLYDPRAYWGAHLIEDTKTILLPDRNVASRFAQLAKGNTVRGDQQLRTAAALLAFAQCLDFEIEPSIAFHELAHKAGNATAMTELAWYRAADNASPHDLIEVALGRQDALSASYNPHDVSTYDLAKPIRRWNRNYIIALKIVELEQLQIKPVDRVLHLFKWMSEDFIFSGPAALQASIYLAPNSAPKSGIFKAKNSRDREAAILGIRNAAWDLTYLSEFARRVNEGGLDGKNRYIFASFDLRLRHLAKLLFKFGSGEVPSRALSTALSEWWVPADAERITAEIFAHIARILSPKWKPKTSSRRNFIAELIRAGESCIREIVPNRKS